MTTEGYTYSSLPHSAPRPTSSPQQQNDFVPLPIHSDPRVIRGSTLAAARKVAAARMTQSTSSSTLPKKTKYRPDSNSTLNFSQTLPNSSTNMSSSFTSSSSSNPTYFYEVSPLVNKNFDLSKYLEEQIPQEYIIKNNEKILKPKNKDKQTQSDQFQNEIVPEVYIPRKTGIDNSTQVELFDMLVLHDQQIKNDYNKFNQENNENITPNNKKKFEIYKVSDYNRGEEDLSTRYIHTIPYNSIYHDEDIYEDDTEIDENGNKKLIVKKKIREYYLNFDLNIRPILSVLVSKTLENSLQELRYEEELKKIREEEENLLKIKELNNKNLLKLEQDANNNNIKLNNNLLNIKNNYKKLNNLKLLLCGKEIVKQCIINDDKIKEICDDNIKKKIWSLPDVELTKREILPKIIDNCYNKLSLLYDCEVVVDG